jgi:hypothetical protein
VPEKRPESVNEYVRWASGPIFTEPIDAIRNRLELAQSKVFLEIEDSAFWRRILRDRPEWNDEYYAKTQYLLFATSEEPKLVRKSFESLIIKTYRKNVLENDEWPDPPDSGWITPDNWFAQLNDLVRSTLVVKYLDGVLFLVENLELLAKELGAVCADKLESRDEGYYAAHFYVAESHEIPTADWKTIRTPVQVEIQVTTQVQEVIRQLTHQDYAERRIRQHLVEPQWQWRYEDEEFVPNYLGHVLHFIEGLIMDVRNRER